MMQALLRSIASLKLSIILLALAMVLIYVGTWAQVDAGIYEVQKQYFHSWIARVPLGVTLPRAADGGMRIPGALPMPGGYTIGIVMLANLLANWFTRYRWGWRQIGVHLVHFALVLLLLGEGWTSIAQIDSQMRLREGETKSYTEDTRQLELAIVDRTPADGDQVYAIAQEALHDGATISDRSLPVTIRIDEFAPNSNILGPMQGGANVPAKATAGVGMGVRMVPEARAGGVGGMADLASMYVTVVDGGKDCGTLLLSQIAPLDQPQKVTLPSGREYWLQLRSKRYLKPYAVTLLKFHHDRYAGTDIPRNYSSRLRLVDKEMGIDREEVVWMNHPLRHRGETFYQSGFQGEDTTILQVVRNPAMLIPYIACAIGGLGMLIQFAFGMARFASAAGGSRFQREGQCQSRQRAEAFEGAGTLEACATFRQPLNGANVRTGAAGGENDQGGRYAAPGKSWPSVAIPAIVGLACVLLLLGWTQIAQVSETDIAAAPIYFDGRLQPLDTVARNALRSMNGRDTAQSSSGQQVSATDWMLELICRPETALQYRMLRIDNPELQSSLKLDVSRNRFAPAEVEPAITVLQDQVNQASRVPAGQRDVVQRQALELAEKLQTLQRASDWMQLLLVPPAPMSSDWRALGPIITAAQAANRPAEPVPQAIATAMSEYRDSGPSVRPQVGARWLSAIAQARPDDVARMRTEVFYNRYQPFILAMSLYVLVFLLACSSLLFWRTPLWRSAMVVAVIALLLHSAAIAIRMYLQGRPPVTNLYSSAIFIGWGAVVLALLIEAIHRNGIALAMASLVGTGTLIIAQNLAQGGETMPAMQAVLDSNFWLTTHVLAITLGYSAAFFAGMMGIAFLVAGISARGWFTEERREAVGRMIYGTACFALLFSFVGTLLGGIWADQSWGRFWGWDPKENGAALIVLWVSIMLHARFVGGGPRALALLAVVANIVTAWSWFGTNMLGVGLHSYGFMDSALWWLLAFVASQLVVIVAGWIFCSGDAVQTENRARLAATRLA